ncbi:MAG TPA: hypothetical protein VGN01_08445 [Acidobacteriaceae bacterium]|jgi:hypothetical protein
MKFLALGLCLLCLGFVSMRLFRMAPTESQKATGTTPTVTTQSPEVQPRRVSASAAPLSAGTVVTVTLADPIDSEHDLFRKQYAASINLIGGEAIAPGSRATVVLLDNNAGWLTQLAELTISGRRFQVLSGAGSVVSAEQPSQAGKPDGAMGKLGLGSDHASAFNQRVLLPAATQLRFVLMGSSTDVRVVAANRRYGYGPAANVATAFDVSGASSPAASREEDEFAYLCRASDSPDRTSPISYYVANVFETSDSKAVVERRWIEFLLATYPYRFANSRRVTADCARLTDLLSDRDAQRKLDREAAGPENAKIVQTRWHYTLGPPPLPASLPETSTLPSRDAQ